MLTPKNNKLCDKVKILVKGKDKTDSIRHWEKIGNKIHIAYSDGKTYSYNQNSVQIKYSALSNKRALQCFEYLKSVAAAVGLHDPTHGNILSNHFEKIDYIDNEDNILASFLTGILHNKGTAPNFTAVYPFGFNISQKIAIDNALSNPLSIIEGPPGTGKTQTILNIIANAVIRGESVAVVSSNNSATANVLDKLKKYEVDFIAAYLGNSENKQQFIESQKPLPNLSLWNLLPEEEIKIKDSLQKLSISLTRMLLNKNDLSKLEIELDNLKTEYQHFTESHKYKDIETSQYLKEVNPDRALDLWLLCEGYSENNKTPGIFGRLINYILHGVRDKKFYTLSSEEMITFCQRRYYIAKSSELISKISNIKNELYHFDFSSKMNEYSTLSAKLFRNELSKKYHDTNRDKFTLNDLWRNSESFIKEYPVILAKTYLTTRL